MFPHFGLPMTIKALDRFSVHYSSRTGGTMGEIVALLVMVFAFLGYMRRVLPKQTYRRTIGGSVWHSSSRCKYWPTENFDEVSESPQFGVCSICVKIENRAGRYPNDGWYGS